MKTKGKRIVLTTGAVAVIFLGLATWLGWPHLVFWYRFAPLGVNAQGFPEYRHRQTGIPLAQDNFATKDDLSALAARVSVLEDASKKAPSVATGTYVGDGKFPRTITTGLQGTVRTPERAALERLSIYWNKLHRQKSGGRLRRAPPHRRPESRSPFIFTTCAEGFSGVVLDLLLSACYYFCL